MGKAKFLLPQIHKLKNNRKEHKEGAKSAEINTNIRGGH